MLSMTDRTPQYPLTIRLPQQGEGEEDAVTHTSFTPNFRYPVVESDEANFVVFSSIPGTAPILPSPGRRPGDSSKNVSKTQATKLKSQNITRHNKHFDLSEHAIDQMVQNWENLYGYLRAEERPKKWACRFCQKTVTASPNDIHRHLRTHQIPEKRPSSYSHRCSWPDCGYETIQGQNCRSHEAIHRGIPEALLRCNLLILKDDGSFRPCLFRCSGKSKMTRHRRGVDPHSPHACDNNRVINTGAYPSPASTPQTVASELEDVPMWTTTSSFDGISTASENSDVDELMSDGESIMGGDGPETASSCSYTSGNDQGPMESIHDQDGNGHETVLDYAGEDDEGEGEQEGGLTVDQPNENTNGQLGYYTDYTGVGYYGYRYPPMVDYYGIGMRYPSYPTFVYPYGAGYVHHAGYIPVSYHPPSQPFNNTGLPHDGTLYQQTIDVDAEGEKDVLSSLEVSNDSDREEASPPRLGRKGYLSWDELLDDPAQLHRPSNL